MKPICVDVCGGDHAPGPMVRAARRAADQGVPVVLVGPEPEIRALPEADGLDLLHADQGIPDSVSPLDAIRKAPRSSIAIGLSAVADGRASAVFSCGASGAIMLLAVRILGLLEEVHRPALAVSLPRPGGPPLLLLDAGANVDCRAAHLLTFAKLGVAWAVASGLGAPRVGLLSNGAEPGKGTAVIRETMGLMGDLPASFVGQVEPHVALAGGCDVLVADGMHGNIMLKSLEAAVEIVRAHFHLSRAADARAEGALADLAWSRFGAASLLGVDGLVFIGHGRSDEGAVLHGIQSAQRAVQARALEGLRKALGLRCRP